MLLEWYPLNWKIGYNAFESRTRNKLPGKSGPYKVIFAQKGIIRRKSFVASNSRWCPFFLTNQSKGFGMARLGATLDGYDSRIWREGEFYLNFPAPSGQKLPLIKFKIIDLYYIAYIILFFSIFFLLKRIIFAILLILLFEQKYIHS